MRKSTKALITAAICLPLFLITVKRGPEPPQDYWKGLSGDTLICLMDIRSAPYEEEDSGFNYALAGILEKDMHCHIHIINARHPLRTDSAAVASNKGAIDLLITNVPADSISAHTGGGSLPIAGFSNESVWLMDGSDISTFRGLSEWISRIKSNGTYVRLHDNFFGNRRTGSISPYDGLVKEFSRRLGWDWRLLSSVIYNESMFINATLSRRGAIGLMQVRPATGAAYGIHDLSSPRNNIDAGTRHLQYLENLMKDWGITDSANLVRFTLAAYNAGEGRIEDCRRLAESLGKNPDSWEEVAEIIPLMSQEEYYTGEYVKRGRFNGKETINYIDKVLGKYEEYAGKTAAGKTS